MPSSISLLTPELSAKICRLVSIGNRAEIAANSLGIAGSTYWLWLEQGRKGREPYAAFVTALEVARAQAEIDAIATQLEGDTIGQASKSASAQFWLKTSRAKHYAEEKRISVEVEHEIDGFLTVIARLVSEDTYVQILTTWQNERDDRSAGKQQIAGTQSDASAKLLRAADVVDTTGKPSL